MKITFDRVLNGIRNPQEVIPYISSQLFPYGTSRRVLLLRAIKSAKDPKLLLNIRTDPPSLTNPIRIEGKRGIKRILVIEIHVPDSLLGAGFPRSFRLLEALSSTDNYAVTFYPLIQLPDTNKVVEYLESLGIEMLFNTNPFCITSLESHLKGRADYYDEIILCRPIIMEALWSMVRRLSPRSRIIYDAEAIYSFRKIAYQSVLGRPMSQAKANRLINNECSLTAHADATICVSTLEQDRLKQFGAQNVHVVSHIVYHRSSNIPPENRQGLLFVGPMCKNSPNEDALLYFIHEIFPIIRSSKTIPLTIAGKIASNRIRRIRDANVTFTGTIPDLVHLYDHSRVFIAPTRYAGGIPIKVLEAAGNGIPCVVTPLIAEQLGWTHGKETLVGDTPQSFANCCLSLLSDGQLWERISTAAQKHIRNKYNEQLFYQNLRNALTPS